jgi:coenzyme F420-dependent glucose-6-phosphate dehydrogenase
VENARLYTLPEQRPRIMVAAGGPRAAGLAARIGDGLIASEPKAEVSAAFEEACGHGKPRHVEMTACWPRPRRPPGARLTVWPLAGFSGPLNQELAIPAHFQKVWKMVTEDTIAQ